MQNPTTDKDKYTHLWRLRDRLTEEIRTLKEVLQEKEPESFENPMEMIHVIKSLQEALNAVERKLEQYSAEDQVH